MVLGGAIWQGHSQASSSDVQRLSNELGLGWTETMEPRTARGSLRRAEQKQPNKLIKTGLIVIMVDGC